MNQENEPMATMNVSLPDPMKEWVESQSLEGRFSNASDYVRHLIRKDQERQAALAALQAEITLGIESGQARPFDDAAFKARMREPHDTN
jgi:antitoxin ParD1/3/4